MYVFSEYNGLINLDYTKSIAVRDFSTQENKRYIVCTNSVDDGKNYILEEYKKREDAYRAVHDLAIAMMRGDKIFMFEKG